MQLRPQDTACTRRIQRRRKSNNQPPLPASQLASTLHAFRSTDERLSRSFGAKNPGQLCVLDDRVPLQETPAVLAEAIAQAVRGMRWQGCTNPREPPLLILGPENFWGTFFWVFPLERNAMVYSNYHGETWLALP